MPDTPVVLTSPGLGLIWEESAGPRCNRASWGSRPARDFTTRSRSPLAAPRRRKPDPPQTAGSVDRIGSAADGRSKETPLVPTHRTALWLPPEAASVKWPNGPSTDWTRSVTIPPRSMQTTMTAPAPPIEIVSFPVEGMTCASCVNRITRFLRKVDGVEDANVNLATETATVRFDPAHRCPSDDLAGRSRRPGTSRGSSGVATAVARPTSQDGRRGPRRARRRRPPATSSLRRRLVVATVLTIPLLGGLARMTVAPGSRDPHGPDLPARPGDAGAVLGRLAVLPRRLEGPAPPVAAT